MKKISETTFTIWSNHRQEPYFTLIKNGQKTIEGRIKKGNYRFLKPGDHIIILNQTETENIEVVVKEIRPYHSFKEMLQKESLKKVLPQAKTVDEGVGKYRQFYTKEQEDKFGVIAITFQLFSRP